MKKGILRQEKTPGKSVKGNYNSLIELNNMPLTPLASLDGPPSAPVSPNQDIPKNELDIFCRTVQAFIPEGKTWETLTQEEKDKVKAQYRHDYMRPGMYQAITGLGNMI